MKVHIRWTCWRYCFPDLCLCSASIMRNFVKWKCVLELVGNIILLIFVLVLLPSQEIWLNESLHSNMLKILFRSLFLFCFHWRTTCTKLWLCYKFGQYIVLCLPLITCIVFCGLFSLFFVMLLLWPAFGQNYVKANKLWLLLPVWSFTGKELVFVFPHQGISESVFWHDRSLILWWTSCVMFVLKCKPFCGGLGTRFYLFSVGVGGGHCWLAWKSSFVSLCSCLYVVVSVIIGGGLGYLLSYWKMQHWSISMLSRYFFLGPDSGDQK